VTHEARVTIAHNGAGYAVKLDDNVEEEVCDGGCHIGIPQWKEVSIFGKPVDNDEDDRFSMNLGQPFNEVDGDISPDDHRYVQWLQVARRMKLLCLIALANEAHVHKLAHHHACS
jgi:hypothetical protein